MTYREPEPIFSELREWDVLLVHDDVKFIGMSHEHVDRCYHEDGFECDCHKKPRMSSPVVDRFGRRLSQDPWTPEAPGDGRALLDVRPGSEVPVLSGKLYRLVGPRRTVGYDSWASASIFHVYAEAPKSPAGFWSRLRALLKLPLLRPKSETNG